MWCSGGSTAATGLTFNPIEGNTADTVTVPDGYAWGVLVRWGDPIVPGTPRFDPDNLDSEAQRGQIGNNADFVVWFDFPFIVGGGGIFGVNHEYKNPELIFPNYNAENSNLRQVDYGIGAHGVLFFRGVAQWKRFMRRPLGPCERRALEPAYPRGDRNFDHGAGRGTSTDDDVLRRRRREGARHAQ